MRRAAVACYCFLGFDAKPLNPFRVAPSPPFLIGFRAIFSQENKLRPARLHVDPQEAQTIHIWTECPIVSHFPSSQKEDDDGEYRRSFGLSCATRSILVHRIRPLVTSCMLSSACQTFSRVDSKDRSAWYSC